MWERGKGGKILGVQPCVGHPALGKGCLLPSAGYQLSNKNVDECPGFIFRLLPTSLILVSFPFLFFSSFLGFFFSFFFSLTESSITESQSFTMPEAEPGICVKGMRKHNEGWPELGACVRWVWRRDGKDGMGLGCRKPSWKQNWVALLGSQ